MPRLAEGAASLRGLAVYLFPFPAFATLPRLPWHSPTVISTMAAVFGDMSDHISYKYNFRASGSQPSTPSTASSPIDSTYSSGQSTMSASTPSVAVDDEGDTSSSVSGAASIFEELSSLISEDDKYTFSTAVKLANYIKKRVEACLASSTGCYLLVTGVPDNKEAQIDSLLARRQIRNQVRIMHEPTIKSLIIKLMPGVPHELTTYALEARITSKVVALPGHTIFSLLGIKAARFYGSGGGSKEGDSGFRPATRASDDFPSFMIEVGYSETMEKLRKDAKWWLTASTHGPVTKMVIIIKINRDPPALELEVWVMGPNTATMLMRSRPPTVPACVQSFDIDAAGTVTPTPAANGLRIPYLTLFDVPHPHAADIIISLDELSELALVIFQNGL
ncbi:hypothetical protein C7212DRAFT_363738 [Tuber magnatum]|uniref:Uncharacterized protein n=1 Tax=Tuber magnatum TaxID=42249 RepID=A0A317SR00_9PEZI|nr:hypothetical protein C7212DRAFT_363738 [Tuber magnatum]